MDENHNELGKREIVSRLNELEARILRIEKGLNIDYLPDDKDSTIKPGEETRKISDETILESVIGESVLAWLGNIVLFFGLSFLIQYIQNSGYQLASSVFGYISVAGIFVLAHFLKRNNPKMASIFNLNAYLLLFYVTLRLHFYTVSPVVSSKAIGLTLLTIVSVIQLFFSVKRKSLLQTGTALLLLSIVAIVSDTTHFMLPMAAVIATISVVFLYRFGWIRIVYLSIILVYLINLFWFFNNPIMGNPLQAIKIHNLGFIYLFAIGGLYSLIALINKSELFSKSGIISAIILNGLGFSTLLLLNVMTFFPDNYVLLIGSISAFCLLYSVLLQIRSNWKILAAFYALYGFVTFSIAVHGIYDFPRAYFLLAIQSLLVVTMAIWFRSKFIVGMNTLLFISLLIFYLSTSVQTNAINISFSLVALVTARVLNWKKDGLTIRTDLLRNIYLVIGFIMVLITLYHLIPARYITLSWTAVAVIYFALSLILKNVKYRYLALGTMIAATFYLFIVDLAKIELVFRILALMFLAIISIGLSIYYSRKNKKKK
ncbi:MAG: hypothetical protein CL661_02385 [Bacteroidetes bacterium]|mgnify:CR=1 FL=1|jgi:hypothetical protein|nr:hypothetical protein [Bacteroidota bacterium]|tara:strand:- start:462 stop:2093 length:1632 start_codon:yes stop_codon:yes gene_type:complete